VKRALAALLLAGCASAVPVDHELAASRARIRTVAVMPPDVRIARHVFHGDDEPLTADMDRVRRQLPALLGGVLARHGFTLKPARLDETDVAGESELRYQRTLVTGRFRAAAAMDTTRETDYRLSLGPEVNRFADRADVDGLLFAEMTGWKKSRGQIARDVATSVMLLGHVVYHTEAADLRVALVDGTTGDILWSATTTVAGRDFAGPALPGLVEAAFPPVPD